MVQQAAISPDGKRVAILGGPAEDRRVSVGVIDTTNMPTLKLGAVETVGLTWAGNDYVIARMAYWDKETAKVAYRIERNITIDTEAKAVARILNGAVGIGTLTNQPIIGIVQGSPPKVIIQGLGEIWRADVATGRGAIQELGSSAGRTYGWAVDSAGEARVRLDADNHDMWVMGRPKGVSSWKPVWSGAYDEDSPRFYYGYSDPDAAVVLYQEKDGVGRLFRRSLTGGADTPFGPPVKDGTFGAVWDDNLQTIVGVAQMQDREAITWLDPVLGATHQALAKLFPTQDVALENWSSDRQRFVIRVTSPADPPVWYLYDKTRKELSPIGEEYPELKGVRFGPTRWLKYKARDGLEIPAYLTLPPPSATAGAGKPPLIVLPHGGPGIRDDYTFDFLTQFLASRGYAVLRPQFRGSAGFGRAFEKAGFGEWGGKMQTDLLDGVAALATSGDVDSRRVCIVGTSFGGYAALAAATLHPDAYECAAAFAGISDLGVLLGEEMRAYGPGAAPAEDLRRLLGKAPKTLLDSTSPARLAAKATIPVLLIHGDKDTVVPIEQSQRMVRAMQAAGRPVQMVTLVDENHYLTHSATRTQMLQALEAFLAKNLPVTRP
jgi:dienelactone hydrolase